MITEDTFSENKDQNCVSEHCCKSGADEKMTLEKDCICDMEMEMGVCHSVWVLSDVSTCC